MSRTKIYQPKITPTATLLIIHGMAEHQSRYHDFAQFIADNGVVVMTYDQLGHGKQAAVDGQLGYMGNPDPNELVIDEAMRHAKQLAQQYPQLPHFVLGHSMGSFITRCIIRRDGAAFDGAIVMSTSSPNPLSKPSLALTNVLNKLAPRLKNPILSNMLNHINNLPFIKEKNMQGFNWINSDRQEIQQYIDDPLTGFTFTNNGFYSLMALMAEGTDKNWAEGVPKNLPILFVSGTDDPVGQMSKGVPNIVNDLQQRHHTDISYHLYQGMRHEILHEPAHDTIYKNIINWLTQHTKHDSMNKS